ncbi:MAG: hypothetical protein JRJ19_14380, partial [Deltaproteobacteria bacterium]|nr:hypothetical protein [Deltaproteobacteria bacterium]
MEAAPNFNFKDVLRAPVAALSAKQILVMTATVVGTLAVYDAFTYLGLAISGEDLSRAFGVYGFFPFDGLIITSIGGQIAYWLGVGLAVLTFMLGFFAVSAINIEAVRGNRFLS